MIIHHLPKIEEGKVITFDESILYKTEEDYVILQNILFGFELNQKMVISEELALKLNGYINLLKNEIDSHKVNQEIVYSLLKIVLISIQDEFTTKIKIEDLHSADLQLFYRFLDHLNESFKTEHMVNYYSEKLNVTSLYLNKMIQKITGKSTLSVIHERIIQESKRLLIHSDQRNKTIAYELGFKDEAYFSRFFKKIVGISPKEFKINVQEKG